MRPLPTITALGAALGLSLAAPAQAKGAAKVPPDIQKAVQAWQSAFNAHDAGRVASMFAMDGAFVNPMGARAEGRDAIEERFAKEFDGPLKGATTETRIESVRMLGRDYAFVELRQQVSGPNLPPQLPQPAVAHVPAVLHRKGNGWQILELRPHFWLTPPAAGEAAPAPGGTGASSGQTGETK